MRSLPLFGLIALAMLSACAGPGLSTPSSAPSLENAVLLHSPRPVAEFQMKDQTDTAFSRANLLGHWTLLFTGFTHCPDVCPMTLSHIRHAEQQLTGPPHHQVVFVSVDPARDTPEVIEAYLGWFSPEWIGLRGDDNELARLLDSLGLAYVRVPLGNEGAYTVDHSTAVMLIDPEGRAVGYWKAPLDATQLAQDLAALPAPK